MLFRTDEQVSRAMAETDLLLASLEAADGGEPFAQGLVVAGDSVRARLAARFQDPVQRTAFAELFAAEDAELDARVDVA